MINPWIGFQKSNQMVHPDDKDFIKRHNSRVSELYKFQLHLAPEPWIGSINAPIVILLANPGATLNDLTGKPQFKANEITKLSLENLNQERANFFHFFFDPILNGTQGQAWYQKAFGTLLNKFSSESLSNNILTCEIAPYHSHRWKRPSDELPTQLYTNFIVKTAVQRNALILIHRGRNYWFEKVPELQMYSRAYFPNSTRSPWISKGNYPKGFDEICYQLES